MNVSQKIVLIVIIEEILKNLEEYEKDSFATSESLLLTFDSDEVEELKMIVKELKK